MSRRVTAPALRLAALAALAGGCGALGLSPDGFEAPPARACGSNDDCAADRAEVCRRPDGTGSPVADADAGTPSWDGICVLRSSRSAAEIYLEVRPTAGVALPVAQLGPISLAAGQNQELVVPAPAAIGGSVVYANPSRPVARARVRFRSRGLIPGRPQTFEVETGASGGDEGRFSRVLPSDAYQVTVLPPDLFVGDRLVPAPAERPFGDALTDVLSGLRTLTFEITGTDELLRFSGAVLDDAAAPVAGIEVWAIDARPAGSLLPTGGRTGPRRVSQPVRTDADGRFTLWLPRVPAGREPHLLELRFGPAAGDDFPSYAPGTRYELTEAFELPAPVVLERVRERVTVTGQVHDRAVSTVRVHTVDREAIGYEALARVDPTGAFTVSVPPGIYLASAQPDAEGAGLGVCVSRGEFRADGLTPVDIYCPPSRRLAGQVIGPRGEPVSGVVVEIARRADVLVAEVRRDQAVTGFNGHFAFEIGDGTYDFSLQPPPEARLPFQVLRALELSAAGTDSLLVVELGAPFELFGRLLGGALGEPLAATLEAYAVDPETGEPLLVGRGLSKADGSYSIVVPAAAR